MTYKNETNPARNDILLQVRENFQFFQSKWKEFCEAVEKAGQILKDYASRPEQKICREEKDEALRTLRIELLKQDEPTPESTSANWIPYSNIQLTCMRSKFFSSEGDIYVPSDTLSYMYCAGVVLPKDGNEDFLLDCAVLCVAYDHWIDVDEPHVYYHGSYKGEYFDCDCSAQRLWQPLQNEGGDDRILRAWRGVKDRLVATKPSETGRDNARANGQTLCGKIKRMAVELYGVTIERIVKAVLNKYG